MFSHCICFNLKRKTFWQHPYNFKTGEAFLFKRKLYFPNRSHTCFFQNYCILDVIFYHFSDKPNFFQQVTVSNIALFQNLMDLSINIGGCVDLIYISGKGVQGFFLLSLGAEIRPLSQWDLGDFFPNMKKKFPISKKKKKKIFFFFRIFTHTHTHTHTLHNVFY